MKKYYIETTKLKTAKGLLLVLQKINAKFEVHESLYTELDEKHRRMITVEEQPKVSRMKLWAERAMSILATAFIVLGLFGGLAFVVFIGLTIIVG